MASLPWNEENVHAIQLIQNIDQHTTVFHNQTVVQNYRDARLGNKIKYFGQNKCRKYDELLHDMYTRRFCKPVYLLVTTGTQVIDMVKVEHVVHYEPRTDTSPPFIIFTFARLQTRQFLKRPRTLFTLNEFDNVTVTKSTLMKNLEITRVRNVQSGIQEVSVRNREFLQILSS